MLWLKEKALKIPYCENPLKELTPLGRGQLKEPQTVLQPLKEPMGDSEMGFAPHVSPKANLRNDKKFI